MDIELVRRISLYNIVYTVALFLLFVFSIFEMLRGAWILSLFELVLGFFFLAVGYHLRKTHRIGSFSKIGIALLAMLFLFLTYRIPSAKGGFVWASLMPLFFLFFVGLRWGSLLNLFYLLISVFIMISGNLGIFGNFYEADMIFRFTGMYIAVFAITFYFEFVRERIQERLSNRNLELKTAIDELTRTEQALRESEQKYRSLIHKASDGIMILQQDRIRMVNPAMSEMLGMEPGSLESERLLPIIHTTWKDQIHHLYRDAENGNPIVLQAVLTHKNGFPLHVELSRSDILFEESFAYLIIVRDITERKRMDREREMSTRKDSILALAVTASHEINQPLMVLRANMEMLMMNFHGDPEQKRYLERCLHALERIQEILGRFREARDVRFEGYTEDTRMAVLDTDHQEEER